MVCIHYLTENTDASTRILSYHERQSRQAVLEDTQMKITGEQRGGAAVGSEEWRVRRDVRQPATWAMASDLDFSPPEVPEPTFLENLLRYGLFLGAIFQLICVLAIIVSIPKSHEAEAEPSEPRSAEVTRKPKAAVPSVNKRPKKETKKKR
ncbi:hypothetical protein H8959_000919 [Pygathrix nigripes]